MGTDHVCCGCRQAEDIQAATASISAPTSGAIEAAAEDIAFYLERTALLVEQPMNELAKQQVAAIITKRLAK